MRARICAILIALLASSLFAQYPETKKEPVTEIYHGVSVTENYRWLENFDDPAVKDWLVKQNEYTQEWLEQIPERKAVADELSRIYSQETVSYYSLTYLKGMLYALKSQPPKQQPFIVAITNPQNLKSERVVIDPNLIDTTGQTAIDFYCPSQDGRLIAVSLSYRGSEDGTLFIFDIATGAKLEDSIPRVTFPTAGGSVAWSADGSGFYYTRYPQPGERPESDMHFYQQVYYHKLGTPFSADVYQVGKEFPRIAEIVLETSHDGKHLLATVENGDGGEYEHFLCDTDGQWSRITKLSDRITKASFGLDNALYLLSLKDTPKGQLLRMSLTQTELSTTRPIITEGEHVINDFLPTASRVYVVEQMGGPTGIKVYDLEGKELPDVPTAPVASVGSPVWLDADRILFNEQTYLTPSIWKQYDPTSSELNPTPMQKTSLVNFDDAEVLREFAISKDGTKVPLNIIRKKGTKLDGSNPTILYGYGGYGVNLTPGFSERNRVWLDMGGIYVVANLRGGGEYGEDWHLQGNLTKKQNVFDDFAAAAQWLIANGYTNPTKLAIEGGSNGGLLMGAALTQHPELYRAVIARVGIYDMLRVELHSNGAFNVTEFGSVKDPDQFKALYSYSPLHNVRDGIAYPAVLLTAGDHDGRVDPYQSRKMAARLQEATSSDHPVLLRTSSTSGHGIGSSLDDRISLETDVLSFLIKELGITYPAHH